jgi:hypothetical protein
VKRADGRELSRITVYLAPPIAEKLRRHCFDNELELSDVSAEVLTAWVENL